MGSTAHAVSLSALVVSGGLILLVRVIEVCAGHAPSPFNDGAFTLVMTTLCGLAAAGRTVKGG